jgi:hypothetical protein
VCDDVGVLASAIFLGEMETDGDATGVGLRVTVGDVGEAGRAGEAESEGSARGVEMWCFA